MTLSLSRLGLACGMLFLAACHGAHSPATPSARRLALVAQLKLLGQRLASGDKHKIAQIFQFPIPDSLLPYYGDDTAFNQVRARDSSTTTAAAFDQYFPEIAREVQFKEFSRVFKRLKVDQLLTRDSIEYDAINKKEPCYNYYRIEIRSDSLVDITFGTNSRKDYNGPETKDENFDISSLCEHERFWDFAFDDQRLRFVRNSGAD